MRVALLLCCLCLSGLPGALPAAEPPLRSRAQVDDYLRQHPDSALHRLSPGARERFLYSLVFDARGLIAADGADLADELTQEQIVEVLALFGPEAVAQAPPSQRDATREPRSRAGDAPGALEQRYNAWYRESRDALALRPAERAQRLAQAFEAHLSGSYQSRVLARADDQELRLLRRAAQDTARATLARAPVEAFRAVFQERQRRDLLSSDDLQTLQGLFLAQRRFADARRLASDFPRSPLPRLPAFRDDLGEQAKHTVWRLDADGRELRREALDLGPAQVLAVVSCERSLPAVRALLAHPRLEALLARHARWLCPPPGVETLASALAWNAALPAAPVRMIHAAEDWRWLPEQDVPVFHVVRDGRLIGTFDRAAGGTTDADRLLEWLDRQGVRDAP